MQVLMVCEDKEDAELVDRIFGKMVRDCKDGFQKGELNGIGDGVSFREDECAGLIDTDRPIAYYLPDSADASYTVWNFATMEKHENVEGDIAGLVNLPNGNFPF